MAFTQFENNNPIVIPSTEQKVYDKFWLSKLDVTAPDPSLPTELVAVFIPARDILDNDGNIIGKEVNRQSNPKIVRVEDLFTMAEQDNDFATAMELVFRALKKVMG